MTSGSWWPDAREQRRAGGKLWFKETEDQELRAKHKRQRQIELKDWSWNSKKQQTRVYVDEIVDKGGNIWGPDAWPDLVHQHFVDLYKAPLVEIMAEKRELESSAGAAIKQGGHARSAEARATLEIALELAERKKASRKNMMSTWWHMWTDPT